jgi:glutamate transport system permease protein
LVLHLDAIFAGMWEAIQLAALSFIGATLFGVTIGTFRISPVASLRALGTSYVEFFRSMPITVLFVFLYFGLPDVKVTISAFFCAVLGLALYGGAYIAEAIRSGFNAVPQGEIEAGRAIGLTQGQLLRCIVLPQAVRMVVAPIGNIFVDLMKDTSIAYTISVIEITGAATNLVSRYAKPVETFIAAGAAYLVLTIPLGIYFRRVEIRKAIKR